VLATSSNYVYLVMLPLVGATPPAINVADTAAASFPVHRLTRVGGDFIGWAPDGKAAYWSVGAASSGTAPLWVIRSPRRRPRRLDPRRLTQAGYQREARFRGKARVDSLAKLPAYEGERVDVTIRVPRDVPRGSVVLRVPASSR